METVCVVVAMRTKTRMVFPAVVAPIGNEIDGTPAASLEYE